VPRTIELRRHRTINLGKVFDVTLPMEQLAESYHAITALLLPYGTYRESSNLNE
jgi:hypothetical protein